MESLAKVTLSKTTKEKPTKERYFLLYAMNKKALYKATTRARFIAGAHEERARPRTLRAREMWTPGNAKPRRKAGLTTENIVKFIMRQSRRKQLRGTGTGGARGATAPPSMGEGIRPSRTASTNAATVSRKLHRRAERRARTT